MPDTWDCGEHQTYMHDCIEGGYNCEHSMRRTDCDICLWMKRAHVAEADLAVAYNDLRAMSEAIKEACRIADDLNYGARCGAGFNEHWGERCMQVARPIRDVKQFAIEQADHIEAMYRFNAEDAKVRDELEAEIIKLKEDVKRYRNG